MMTRKVTYLCLSLVLAAACPSQARAESILNTWFPGIFGAPQTGPKPEDTLQAPFQIKADKKPSGGLAGLYQTPQGAAEETTTADTPHRSADQVASWATGQMADALSVRQKDSDPSVHAKRIAATFDPYALTTLQKYLSDGGLYEYVRSARKDIVAFVDGRPRTLGEGPVQGVYRWKIELPLLLSYLDPDVKTMQGMAAPQTQKIITDVQIRRDEKTTDPDHLVIERIDIRAVH